MKIISKALIAIHKSIQYIALFLLGMIAPMILLISSLIAGTLLGNVSKAPDGYVWRSTGTKYNFITSILGVFGLILGLVCGGYILSWISKHVLGKKYSDYDKLEANVSAIGSFITVILICAYILLTDGLSKPYLTNIISYFGK